MNYRHIYHAGNFADVMKHVILVQLVKALQKKTAGFCYLDTHAGIGDYDLQSEAAQKTQEAEEGIKRLLQAENVPPAIEDYLQIVRSCSRYPGSPRLVQTLLRPQDRMVLNELHPEDCLTLKENFKSEAQIAIHCREAYEVLGALLPPPEKRGLILIDPPYESPDEEDCLLQGLEKAFKKFPTGIYAIWLPIKNIPPENWFKKLQKILISSSLLFKLDLKKSVKQEGLRGSCMIILNPPFQFEPLIEPVLSWLKRVLS